MQVLDALILIGGLLTLCCCASCMLVGTVKARPSCRPIPCFAVRLTSPGYAATAGYAVHRELLPQGHKNEAGREIRDESVPAHPGKARGEVEMGIGLPGLHAGGANAVLPGAVAGKKSRGVQGSKAPHVYDEMQDALSGYDEVEMEKFMEDNP